jgi:hypothetical protein
MHTGPIYCETGHPWLGIAEPVNFATNAFIIVAAIFAARLIQRSPYKNDTGLWLLVALLACTGIGSFLWHGLRTPFTLALDTWSGLLFLLALVAVWFEALYGLMAGIAATAGFTVAALGSLFVSFRLMMASAPSLRPLMFAPFFLIVTGAGVWLVAATRTRAGQGAARIGMTAIGCGLAAAAGRSLDLPLCPYPPFGTHFLWHILLSLAAYLSIAALLSLKNSGRVTRLM